MGRWATRRSLRTVRYSELVEISQGQQYRFLYVSLHNRGDGWKIAEDGDTRSATQMLVDTGCKIIYQPQYPGDIAVGQINDTVIGVATLYGQHWAVDLSDRSDRRRTAQPT